MDTAQWRQEIVVKPIEEIIPNTFTKQQQQQQPATGAAAALERKTRPQKEQALNCPRCNSTNTKFCYYNNYSLTQPRYFCKTCRRYWTEGGSLRNIPVGGGSRKNKRSSSSSSPSSMASSKKLSDFVVLPQNPSASAQINNKAHEGQDLNLAFPSTQDFRSISEFAQVPNGENSNKNHQIPSSSPTTSTTTNPHHLSALELLTGITSSRGFSSFMPMPIPDTMNTIFTSGYHHMQDFKPSLNFTLDHGLGSGYGSFQAGVQDTSASGRVLFPFEDLKQASSTTTDVEQINRGHADSTGYWTGMLGGGSW